MFRDEANALDVTATSIAIGFGALIPIMFVTAIYLAFLNDWL